MIDVRSFTFSFYIIFTININNIRVCKLKHKFASSKMRQYGPHITYASHRSYCFDSMYFFTAFLPIAAHLLPAHKKVVRSILCELYSEMNFQLVFSFCERRKFFFLSAFVRSTNKWQRFKTIVIVALVNAITFSSADAITALSISKENFSI